MSVTCLSMRFEPSTGRPLGVAPTGSEVGVRERRSLEVWREELPPWERLGFAALGVTGVSDWGYIWNKRVSYICSSHTPRVITRR